MSSEQEKQIELLLLEIQQIEEQLQVPNLMGSAKGLSQQELASWIKRARSARDYRVERLVNLRWQIHQERVAEKSAHASLAGRIASLEKQLANSKQENAKLLETIQEYKSAATLQAQLDIPELQLPQTWQENTPTAYEEANNLLRAMLEKVVLEIKLIDSGEYVSETRRKNLLRKQYMQLESAVHTWAAFVQQECTRRNKK